MVLLGTWGTLEVGDLVGTGEFQGTLVRGIGRNTETHDSGLTVIGKFSC